ncbi:MAG: RHS repeat-associated core domain-containing protein, partial [Kiritimatiellae bacterium]|nr:RHS repeat-associated core domain-containing protein [Kiritimatiellia bacterium]
YSATQRTSKERKAQAGARGDRDFKAGSKIRSEERYPATQRQQSIAAYVDSTGAVSAEYEYDPFGKVIAHTGRDFDFLFSTKFYDPDIDMYYYGYRHYSPKLRRWISPDPIGETGGMNLYGFCGNNSVSFIDIYGMFTFDDFKGKPAPDVLYSAKTSYSFDPDANPGEILFDGKDYSGEFCKDALKVGDVNGKKVFFQDPKCPCEKCYTNRARYSEYTISVQFQPEKSWVRHPNIDGLLRHENLHLIIAQKIAQAESVKLTAMWVESNFKFCDESESKDHASETLRLHIKEQFEKSRARDNQIQSDFDEKTEHGSNYEEEEKWEKDWGYP